MKHIHPCWWTRFVFGIAAIALCATAQPARSGEASEAAQAPSRSAANEPLDALVREAIENSPEVLAARKQYQAAARVPRQAATLPDPELSLQQLTVGGPKPFEGYETSDFFYTGFGVAQEIPWPRKLKLRASRASHEAESVGEAVVAAQRQAAEAVRENYFELYYLDKRLGLLQQNRNDLSAIARITGELYQVGKGQQQDVIKSQFQETAILNELEMTRLEIAQRQASLKAVLGRDEDSPNIRLEEIVPSTLALDRRRLAGRAESAPDVEMAMHDQLKSEDSLELARTDFVPDFSVGYMYQKTGPGFRDYFMLTLGAKLPLYFWRKQKPALEQALLEREAANHRLRNAQLSTAAELDRQWLAMTTQERIINLYRQALIPQAASTRDSAMAAYRTGRVDFQTLLSAVIDVVNVNEQYYRAIADHEIAVARIEQIVGDQP